MSLREWLNNNSAAATIVAVVALVLALAIIVWQNRSGRASYNPPKDAYFFDLNEGRIFKAAIDQIAPIDAPSGDYEGMQGGVRAWLYSCGECPEDLAGMTVEELDDAGAFVGWLEMYTPEAKQALIDWDSGKANAPKPHPGRGMAAEPGLLVRTLDDTNWFDRSDRDGFNILISIDNLCPGDHPKQCLPE